MKSSGKYFLSIGAQKMQSRKTSCISRWQLILAVTVPQGTGFETMKATGVKPPQTETEKRCCERPGEAIHEGAASIAVKTSEFKAVIGTDKALYHTAVGVPEETLGLS